MFTQILDVVDAAVPTPGGPVISQLQQRLRGWHPRGCRPYRTTIDFYSTSAGSGALCGTGAARPT